MNDPDQTISRYGGISGDLPEHLWAYDDLAAAEDRPAADLATGLTSLGFIRSALRRGAWLWCMVALLGMVIGYGMYTKYPPAYHATATVLLIDNPNEDPTVEAQTDASLAQSLTVAQDAIQQLRLPQTAASFQKAYTVTVVSDQVLTFNLGAPSSAAATSGVTALANAFLKFRADYVRNQQQQLVAYLNQQFDQAQKTLDSINTQISALSTQPNSPGQQAKLNNLLALRGNADQTEQYVTGTETTTQTAANKMVRESQILDSAVAIPRSHLKSVAFYVAAGLIGGLVIGMAIVIVAALVSDRLRRRDDVAEALGAPVRLSVGSLGGRRFPPPAPWRAGRRDLDMKRVVAHLRGAVPGSSRGPAGLAVVAVDNTAVVARAVAALATSSAREGRQVVLADLSAGAYVARLLGAARPGVHPVSQDGARLMVAVPEPEDVAPVGPLQGGGSSAILARADEALVAACSAADLLITLATLDPAFGGDYLSTWATEAVAVVTAGQSSAERIRGVGEMIKLAGTRLASVVLIGADKGDESLGLTDSASESVVTRLVGAEIPSR